MPRSAFHSESDLAAAYDAHADAVFRHCYFRTFDRELGKTLMLDTFRETWTFIAEGNCIDDMKMFLYRTANTLIAAAAPSAKVQVHGAEDRVISTLRQVPSEDRNAFILRQIDGLSAQEAASVLGESVETLNGRVQRCMNRIAALA